MTDENNGAVGADEELFTEEEQAILRGEESEEEGGEEQAAEGAEEATEGEEQADGAEQPDAAQGQPEAATDAERQGSIPSWRLREETEKRRALEDKWRQSETEKARYEERLNILLQWAQNQNQAAEQANQPPPPDKNEDPIGYLNWELEQTRNQLQGYEQRFQQLDQSQQQQQETYQQQQQRQQMWQAYNGDVQAFAAEQPDFADAMKHLESVRIKELEAMGFQGPQIQQQVNQDFEQFVMAAMQNGRRPSEALYSLAQSRLYQPNASPQQQQAAATAAAQGQQAQPGQQPGDKLRKIAQGQASNKSLSGSGSGSPQPMDAAAIAGMDDDEFAGWYQQNFSDAKLQKMLGY